MGILAGLAPWIVYWVLVGNVPFTAAVLAALAVAVLSFAVARASGRTTRTLEIGAIGVFAVLTVLTFVGSESFVERWIQPLGNAGILLVALIGVLIGKPFVREFAEAEQPAEVVASDAFGAITTTLTWVWVAAFAAMTVSSAIPPILQGDATILDTRTPLSFVCYWVIPFVSLGGAAVASRLLSDQMITAAANPGAVRRTSFVAFRELAIDELYYLAREKVEREVGAGMEAYDVNVGSSGMPLTGDESRESWPATYKVRARR